MDEPVPLPVLSVGDAPGTALVFLPGVNVDRLERVSFEVEDDVLNITCFYDEEAGQTFEYPVQVTDENRDTIQSMERLAVMNPSEVEPRKLTSDPEQISRLKNVMKEVKSLTTDPDESGNGSPDLTENGQDGIEENGNYTD